MNRRTAGMLLLTLCFSLPSANAKEEATVAGSRVAVPILRVGDRALLDAEKTGAAFGWKLKVVTPGKLITFCRTSGCIPVRLGKVKFKRVEKRLFVDAAALGKALGFSIRIDKGKIRLVKLDASKRESTTTPAYNARWGTGRGFRQGQTLPDIPLVDLEGREVRFSKFLGRQYIIYCWASW